MKIKHLPLIFLTASLAPFAAADSGDTYVYRGAFDAGGGNAWGQSAVNWSLNGEALASGNINTHLKAEDTMYIAASAAEKTGSQTLLFVGLGPVTFDKLVTENTEGAYNLSILNYYSYINTINVNTYTHTFLESSTGYMRWGAFGSNTSLGLNLNVENAVTINNQTSDQRVAYIGTDSAGAMESFSFGSLSVEATKLYIRTRSGDNATVKGAVTFSDTSAGKAELVLNQASNWYSTKQNFSVGSLVSLQENAGKISIEGNLNAELKITGSSGTATFSGDIIDSTSGTGKISITKSGAGTQILSGQNTFKGNITINGGTLVLTHTGTVEYVWLNGNGAFGNYGESTMTVHSLDWTSGGIYADFSKQYYGFTANDVYMGVSSISALDASYFEFLNIINVNPNMEVGDSTGNIRIITGDFSDISSGTNQFAYLDGNYEWDVTLTADNEGFYINAVLTGIIPEPSTYAAIFGALALALAAYKRRK